MWANHSRFAPWASKLWEQWRLVEQKGPEALRRYCSRCGFVHREHNHAPRAA